VGLSLTGVVRHVPGIALLLPTCLTTGGVARDAALHDLPVPPLRGS
jgi:hypothetical protein